MSTVLVIPQGQGVSSLFITVDAVPSQVHQHRATITEDPVEEGANTSDHYRAEMDSFTLDMVFTDQPIAGHVDFTDGVTFEVGRVDLDLPDGSGAMVLQADGVSNRSQRVYDELLGVQQEGRLIEVITARRVYVNVGIKNLVVTRTARDGSALKARIECKAIREVASQTTTAAIPTRPRGNAGGNAGARPGSEGDGGDDQTGRSALHRLLL